VTTFSVVGTKPIHFAGPLPHRTFVTLDGLRGVAAIAVALGHYRSLVEPINAERAYLAVDLFFILSGFVLAYSYQQQLASTMSSWAFMRRRLIRLYPCYLLGTFAWAVGAAAAVAAHAHVTWTARNLAASLLASIFFVPAPWSGPQGGVLYPLNIPAWSLLWELLINLFYALIARRLTNTLLISLIGISGLTLIFVTIAVGNINVGATWSMAFGGAPRVTFGFFTGVGIFRLYAANKLPRLHLPAPVLLTVCAALLVSGPGAVGGIFGVIVVLGLFPCIVAAAVQVEPVYAARVFTLLGIVSYPFYMIHYPALQYLLRFLSMVSHDHMKILTPWLGLFVIAGLLVICWWIDRYFDSPLRKWLAINFAAPAPQKLIGDRAYESDKPGA
jgi:peptidoglycan/LPS O-acetylase OafA/YrhL